jgi:hypothetical protein
MEEKTEKKENANSPVFISLSQAAKISGYTAEHLNLLCRKKILKGQKVGRNWDTTKEWLADFLASASGNGHKRKSEQEKEDKKFLEKGFFIPVRKIKEYSAKENLAEKSLPLSEKNFYSRPAAIYAETQATLPKNKSRANFSPGDISRPWRSEKLVRDKSVWLNLIAKFSFLILIGLLFFSGAPVVRYIWNNYELIGRRIPVEVSEDSWLFSNEPGKIEVAQTGKVKGEEAESASGSIATSENFRLREISFGGVLLASAEGENLPLEISEMKTKTFMSRDGKEAQALITWKTNKSSVSEITYGRIDSQLKKTMQEEYFGFNHSVALASLDLGATYVFEVTARDKWDRTVLSDKFSVYTGSKIISVFELIIKALNDTFSWAIKD